MNMQQINRQKVFYITGFDPFPARRYRELYRANSQEQATISGYTISQSALHLKDRFGWQVNASFGDQDCEAEIEVLIWSKTPCAQVFKPPICNCFAQRGFICRQALWQM